MMNKGKLRNDIRNKNMYSLCVFARVCVDDGGDGAKWRRAAQQQFTEKVIMFATVVMADWGDTYR